MNKPIEVKMIKAAMLLIIVTMLESVVFCIVSQFGDKTATSITLYVIEATALLSIMLAAASFLLGYFKDLKEKRYEQ